MKAGGSLKPATLETVTAREHYAWQDGKRVFVHAVKGMTSTCEEVLRRNKMTTDDVQWIVNVSR